MMTIDWIIFWNYCQAPGPGRILLSATEKDLIKWSSLTFDNIPRLVVGLITPYLSP